jgi:hypothetical protein
MANTVIQLRNSTVTGNVPSSLANGEISINSRDGKFFYSTPAGAVITHYPYLGPAGLNKEIQFNDSGVLGSSSGLSFDRVSGSLNVSSTLNVSGRDLGAYANAAFLQANTPSNVANSASVYANGAFTRANNSLNANTGGTITANVIISANLTASNIATQTYIQFADGSKQYTANAGSGGGASGNSFGVIYTANNNTFANATTANAQVNFVGESGVVVYANSITKTITVAGTPGAQGLTVDYGFVADPLFYAIDYGTL